MFNPFQLAGNDQSLFYLGQIFGNMGTVLTGTGPNMFSYVFRIFNTALLSLGGLLVGYTIIGGVIKTASEGEFIGKQWSTLWVPVRVLAAAAGLFPTASGYCVIQLIFMWFIVQGVGMADVVWGQAVNYFSAGGTVFTSQPSTGDVSGALPGKLSVAFQNLVCQAAVTKSYYNDVNAIPRTTYNPDTHTFSFGRAGAENECGTLVLTGSPTYVPDPNDPQHKKVIAVIDPAAIAAQEQAMKTILPVLEILSAYYVNQVIQDPTCWSNLTANGQPCVPGGILGNSCLFFNKYTSFNTKDSGGNDISCLLVKHENADAVAKNLITFAGSNPMSDAIKLFYGYANNYSIQSALQAIPQGTSPTNPAYSAALNNGWVNAGAYYYYIAVNALPMQSNYNTFINGVSPVLVTFPAMVPSSGDFSKFLSFTETATNAAGSIAQSLVGSASSAVAAGGERVVLGQAGGSAPGQGQMAMGALNNTSASVINMWVKAISPGPNQDPIVSLHNFGRGMLIAAEVLFWVFFGIGIIIGFLSTDIMDTAIVIFGIGLGFTLNYAAGIFQFVKLFLVPVLYILLGYLIIVGGSLGVYLPLIPYVFFTFGAIGWFVAVIESMVAAPVVAIGMLSPGGQHAILGRAENTLTMLMNLFFRPAIMVLGLIAGMLLSIVVVQLINAAFFSVVGSFSSSLGMIETFLFIVAYASMVITALNKCYTLIFAPADAVITWVGGRRGTAEAEVLRGAGEAQGISSQAAQATGKAAGGAAGTAMKGAAAAFRTRMKEYEDRQKVLPGIVAGKKKPGAVEEKKARERKEGEEEKVEMEEKKVDAGDEKAEEERQREEEKAAEQKEAEDKKEAAAAEEARQEEEQRRRNNELKRLADEKKFEEERIEARRRFRGDEEDNEK